jgi:hypothetical protein
MKIINEENLRTPTDDYFAWVMCIDDSKKQRSPFIIIRSDEIAIYYTLFDLEIHARKNDVILQAWKGKWSDDVFKFKNGELDDYRKRRWEEEHGRPYPKPKELTSKEKKKRKMERDDLVMRHDIGLPLFPTDEERKKEKAIDLIISLIDKYSIEERGVEAYRIVEEKNGEYLSLFHGTIRSRK